MSIKKILMFKGKPVNDMNREELLVAVHGIMDMYDRERQSNQWKEKSPEDDSGFNSPGSLT